MKKGSKKGQTVSNMKIGNQKMKNRYKIGPNSAKKWQKSLSSSMYLKSLLNSRTQKMKKGYKKGPNSDILEIGNQNN